MAGISLTERASIVRMRLDDLEVQEEVAPGILIYRHADDLYFVPTEEDLNEDEEGLLEELTEAKEMGYGSTYPKPLDEHIISGNNLVVTPTIVKTAAAFLNWVRHSDEAGKEDEYVLVLPGALLSAMFDEGAIEQVECYLYFPVPTRLLEDADRMEQARFAVNLINGLSHNLNVVFDGQVVRNVIPNTASRRLVREYEESLEDEDPPVIRELIEQMYAATLAQADILQAWLDSKDADVLPPDMEIVDYAKGILGSQNEGSVVLYGDDYLVPNNMIEKIRDEELFD